MHSVNISSHGALRATTIEQASVTEPIDSVSRYETVQKSSSPSDSSYFPTVQEKYLVWYRGCFGRVGMHVKSRSLSTSKSHGSRQIALSEEKTIKIMSVFLRKTFELRLLSSLGQISRTLRTYPMMASGAPIFKICKEGDVEALQAAISTGTISPFVTDQNGWSLLHVRFDSGPEA